MSELVLPFGFDLAWQGKDVVVGPGTARRCQTAYAYFLKHPGSRIVVTAGQSPVYGAVMSQVMKSWFTKQCPPVSPTDILAACALEFTTWGECAELVYFLSSKDSQKMFDLHGVDHIVIVTDSWHTWRTWLTLKAFLWRAGLAKQIRVSVAPAESTPSWSECIHEAGGIGFYALRFMWDFLRRKR